MYNIKRRTFLEFLGISMASTAMLPISGFTSKRKAKSFYQKGIPPSSEDSVVLADGLDYDILIKWEDKISRKDYFGFNNDYLAYLPFDAKNQDEGWLWVNHEYVDPMFVSGYLTGPKSKDQVKKEMYNVGGSILKVCKQKGKWKVEKSEEHNRRITGFTNIPFNWYEPILGSKSAQGTLGNCAGGITPWGTILTCEENYDSFYGERDWETGERKTYTGDYGWYQYYDNPPEHYGWVVEVNLQTGEAQKHVALGRCAHECATVKELPDGRLVVYTGDDANFEHLYKFVSSKPGSLSEGTLYVANMLMGRWMSLNYDEQPTLQAKFKNQTEVLIRLRQAAKYVGATPLDRPEDIEIDPHTGDVLVALTNNAARGNYTGSIIKIMEKDGRHDSLTFRSDTFLTGGEDTGFASPDNLAFDPRGNLWFTCDVSASAMHRPEYLPYKNNALFVVPFNGTQAGEIIRMASAPIGAEFTGPFFSPDGETLFLSVQHPGEYSKSPDQPSSRWPDGGNSIPRPSVIAIYGEGLYF